MKSCFYPLIGDQIFGWIGDLIDTISITTTLFGISTSLGIGSRLLSNGLLSTANARIGNDVTFQVQDSLGYNEFSKIQYLCALR